MRATLDFLLHGWLGVTTLLSRPRFADHSAETFSQVLDTCERIAREKFAPFNRLCDTQEPRLVETDRGVQVHLPQATHDACAAYVGSGMLAAAQDYESGGMQLPCAIEMAANAFFSKASVSLGGYAMLTSGNANLLMAGDLGAGPMQYVYNMTMFQHFLGIRDMDGPYWSLAIELTFYFLISLLMGYYLLRYVDWFLLLWLV